METSGANVGELSQQRFPAERLEEEISSQFQVAVETGFPASMQIDFISVMKQPRPFLLRTSWQLGAEDKACPRLSRSVLAAL